MRYKPSEKDQRLMDFQEAMEEWMQYGEVAICDYWSKTDALIRIVSEDRTHQTTFKIIRAFSIGKRICVSVDATNVPLMKVIDYVIKSIGQGEAL
jgi:hypothetical protein